MALGALPHAPLLGPVLLGTILRDKGYKVSVLECAFRPLQRTNLLQLLRAQPNYVLISSTFIEETAVMGAAVELIRREAPKAKIILGGPTLVPNQEMRFLADYCVLGEGEAALPALIAALEAGENPLAISGVWAPSVEASSLKPPKLLPTLENAVPRPDWSLTTRSRDEFFPVFTQRGCFWRCAFCSYPANEGYKLRYRTTEEVLEEIRRNYVDFGIWRTLFLDSTFTHPYERCLEIAEGIAKMPFRAEWMAFGRVDNITPELAEVMARSGCKGLFFGCDSGDDQILLKMNKRFTSADIRRGIALTRKSGISCTGSWIIGFPGETKETVANTLSTILEVGCEQNIVHRYSIYEVSPVGLRKEKFGIEGTFGNWRHSTMDNAKAERWVKWILLKMLSKGMSLSSTYDIAWLSTIGYSPNETLALFASIQNEGRSKFLLKHQAPYLLEGDQEAISVTERCNDVFRKALAHPLYAPRKAGAMEAVNPSGIGCVSGSV
jgi:anaerobic magnesium-protoporphyrin IX monomethyl ester cyclase